jgi:putative phosphoesterase
MLKVGVISDTHGHFDSRIFEYFKNVDEIWHAGDVGNLAVLDEIKAFKKTRVVYGNIDGHEIRSETKEVEVFQAEGKKVLLLHIAGRPGKYSPKAAQYIQREKPDIVVCGHSHICMVKFDQQIKALWMNPGAFGIKGFHQVRTLLRFTIDGTQIKDLEVLEVKRKE